MGKFVLFVPRGHYFTYIPLVGTYNCNYSFVYDWKVPYPACSLKPYGVVFLLFFENVDKKIVLHTDLSEKPDKKNIVLDPINWCIELVFDHDLMN